jgi:hypothetical protein
MPVVPGDSGAWIYHSSTLQLCGHVLAWSDKRKTAYIAPMEVLFEDIKKTLDAEQVSLPSAGEKAVPRSSALSETQSSHLNQQLEVSREVELALREMKMSDDAGLKRPTKAREVELALREMKMSDDAGLKRPTKATDGSRLNKDVPDSVQAAVDLKNMSQSLSDRSRTQESGVVR